MIAGKHDHGDAWQRGGALLAGLSLLLLQACTTAQLRSYPQVGNSAVTEPVATYQAVIKVMTLNLAHGRGSSFHQLLLDDAETLNNLHEISDLLCNERPDVVAFQEADAPSFWSGGLDHIAWLADTSNFKQHVHGRHADGIGVSYGTALMSTLELRTAEAITFDPAYSLTPKGFVVSTINWPAAPEVEVDVVSVHLAFSSEAARRKQARELIDVLRERNRPVIIMGDLNSDWQDGQSSVRYLSEALELEIYLPGHPGLETFPGLNRRLDWILVSADFEFRSYRRLPDVVSDHRAVVAELVLKAAHKSGAGNEPG
ncbi:MAG: endonuclease/exonuclease/phosphatase family protein [Gammaproteobacteria bacterium]|nr:MAG: endonuclease/exonuclease/phosphatase family protein [Gammaproteobacteria bacterium]